MADHTLLKVDKDVHVAKPWIHDYVITIGAVCKIHRLKVKEVRMTQTRKGQHFYIQLNRPVSSELANRLQWLLGDDCRRVDFNHARIDSGLEEWNKLFEKPEVRMRTLYRKRV